MTRRLIVVVSVAALIGAGTWASRLIGEPTPAGGGASPGSNSTVGVVDFVRIFNESDQIRDLNELIRKQEVEVQTEAKQRQEVIENKQIELAAFKPGTPDYQSRRKELIRLGTEANIWLKVAEQDLESQKFDWTRMIYEKAVEIVGVLSKERGYSVVLQYKAFTPDDTDQTLATIKRMIQDRGVVYADKNADVTDEVLRRLNEFYRSTGGKKQLSPSTADAPKP